MYIRGVSLTQDVMSNVVIYVAGGRVKNKGGEEDAKDTQGHMAFSRVHRVFPFKVC